MVVDGRIAPQAVGALPPQMAAWDLRILNVEAMMLRAVLEHDREAVYQADHEEVGRAGAALDGSGDADPQDAADGR